MTSGFGRVIHHPEYYLQDGSVSFLADGILFRVYRSYFERESDVFRELFDQAAQDDPQAGTDACPFTLDVTPDEFSQLLWVWFDREYGYRQQTKENWTTILRLAKRWHFDKISEFALREIGFLNLTPAERISIYDEHGIDGERLLSSCVEMCKSPTVPSEAEARLIRMDKLIRILQAREVAQRKAVEMGHESPTSACLEDEALREIVSEHFKAGLNPQSSGTSTRSGGQAPDLSTKEEIQAIIVRKPEVPDRNVQSDKDNIKDKGDKNKDKEAEKKEAEKAEKAEKVEKAKKEAEKKTEQKSPTTLRERTRRT